MITYTNPFMQQFAPLKTEINDYTYFGRFIRDTLNNNEIVGVFCEANIKLKKMAVKEKIENEINKLRLPLIVIDETPAASHFKIIFKTKPASSETKED